jgi:hypothetical protein
MAPVISQSKKKDSRFLAVDPDIWEDLPGQSPPLEFLSELLNAQQTVR